MLPRTEVEFMAADTALAEAAILAAAMPQSRPLMLRVPARPNRSGGRTDGRRFRWSTGRRSARGRVVFAFTPAHDIVTTARRVALLREELRRRHSYSRYIQDGRA
nr:hypothetical protein [Microbispora cellulosiformans]